MDPQAIEILGRNRLVDELIAAGLEVADPVRDRGVDLIAYVDLEQTATKFIAVPIQLKAASAESFSIDRKYSKISDLVLAYVWGLRQGRSSATYALSYPQALSVAEQMGWTQTESWARGRYTTSKPSARLKELLEPYRMSPTAWRQKLGVGSGA